MECIHDIRRMFDRHLLFEMVVECWIETISYLDNLSTVPFSLSYLRLAIENRLQLLSQTNSVAWHRRLMPYDGVRSNESTLDNHSSQDLSMVNIDVLLRWT